MYLPQISRSEFASTRNFL